jgi:hypothetical protein
MTAVGSCQVVLGLVSIYISVSPTLLSRTIMYKGSLLSAIIFGELMSKVNIAKPTFLSRASEKYR